MEKKYIIIGGVAGGASAAARLRRLDEKAKITILERGQAVSFASCGLPYYIGGVISSRDALTLHTPGSFKKQFNIDVKVNTEVISIDRHSNTVRVRDISTGKEYWQKYDKLVLAPGAAAVRPEIEGMDSEKVFTLRNIPDTVSIAEYIHDRDVKRAVVVGGGYIGLEVAENLSKRGINTIVVELAEHVLPMFDYDMAQFVALALEENGVSLITKTSVESFVEQEDGLSVVLSNGKTLFTDFAIVGVGISPEVKLARDAGLGIGVTGGIIVDEHQQTTDKDIYAAGDAVEVESLSGGKAIMPFASPAAKQGKIAADNICGLGAKYKKTLGVSVLKLFDYTYACAGLNEKQLIERGEKYEKIYTRSYSHVTYYPGASLLTIKMMFDKRSGRIFGVQIAGKDGVDKRIDVFATAIRAGLTADKLTDLELAYTPQFGAAKDAINIAGYVASNVMNGISDIIQWHDLSRDENAMLLDVRTNDEFNTGTINGAVNIPLDELRERLDEIPKDKEIIVICRVGRRAYVAERILKQRGFNAKNLTGGYSLYEIFTRRGADGYGKV